MCHQLSRRRRNHRFANLSDNVVHHSEADVPVRGLTDPGAWKKRETFKKTSTKTAGFLVGGLAPPVGIRRRCSLRSVHLSAIERPSPIGCPVRDVSLQSSECESVPRVAAIFQWNATILHMKYRQGTTVVDKFGYESSKRSRTSHSPPANRVMAGKCSNAAVVCRRQPWPRCGDIMCDIGKCTPTILFCYKWWKVIWWLCSGGRRTAAASGAGSIAAAAAAMPCCCPKTHCPYPICCTRGGGRVGIVAACETVVSSWSRFFNVYWLIAVPIHTQSTFVFVLV
jgi:hypothetical protein